VHTPDLFHDREEQRRRTRARDATEAAAKVRWSQRLAAKHEARFVSMLEVAVKKKASTFDLSAASPSLAADHADTGLVDAPLTSIPSVLSRANEAPRMTSSSPLMTSRCLHQSHEATLQPVGAIRCHPADASASLANLLSASSSLYLFTPTGFYHSSNRCKRTLS
jgi:membrane-bound lytic murein transglycosylase